MNRNRRGGKRGAANVPEHVQVPEAVIDTRPVEVETREVAKPEPERAVYATERKCPRCGSIRSRLVKTEPCGEGRIAWRGCKACGGSFKVFESTSR